MATILMMCTVVAIFVTVVRAQDAPVHTVSTLVPGSQSGACGVDEYQWQMMSILNATTMGGVVVLTDSTGTMVGSGSVVGPSLFNPTGSSSNVTVVEIAMRCLETDGSIYACECQSVAGFESNIAYVTCSFWSPTDPTTQSHTQRRQMCSAKYMYVPAPSPSPPSERPLQ